MLIVPNRVMFFFLFLAWMSFPSMLIKKVAMTHLWSLLMWIMSLASASSTFLKYLRSKM